MNTINVRNFPAGGKDVAEDAARAIVQGNVNVRNRTLLDGGKDVER